MFTCLLKQILILWINKHGDLSTSNVSGSHEQVTIVWAIRLCQHRWTHKKHSAGGMTALNTHTHTHTHTRTQSKLQIASQCIQPVQIHRSKYHNTNNTNTHMARCTNDKQTHSIKDKDKHKHLRNQAKCHSGVICPCPTQTIYIAPVCPIAIHVKPLLSACPPPPLLSPHLLAAPPHFFSLWVF